MAAPQVRLAVENEFCVGCSGRIYAGEHAYGYPGWLPDETDWLCQRCEQRGARVLDAEAQRVDGGERG